MSGKLGHRCAAISAGLAFSLVAVASPQLALAEDAPKATAAVPSRNTTAAQAQAMATPAQASTPDQPAGERDAATSADTPSAGSDQSPAPAAKAPATSTGDASATSPDATPSDPDPSAPTDPAASPTAPAASSTSDSATPAAPGATTPADPAADPAPAAGDVAPSDPSAPADPAAAPTDPATTPTDPTPATGATVAPTLDPAPRADDPTTPDPAATPAPAVQNMYRLYNPNTGEHFYTASLGEAKHVAEAGWRWEGIGWVAPASSGTPVYRLYNPNAGDHHYTTSAGERDWLTSLGWRYEGIGWYSDASDALPVYRQYNPNAKAGAHNFTQNHYEDQALARAGWKPEGIGWYASTHSANAIQGFWLVCRSWGSLSRYWVGSDATIVKSRLVTPDEGAGYYAYATSSGAVLDGVTNLGDGRIALAHSNGEVEMRTGWIVDDYGSGLQRYYLYRDPAGYSYAREGYSTDGWAHYTYLGVGYIARDRQLHCNNRWYTSDNDGRLTEYSDARTRRVDSYVNWALDKADDDSHGYDQYDRWGPNYDCSSLVISALRAAGISTGGASYTGNMVGNLSGFKVTKVSHDQFGLLRGDILLNSTHHTGIYIGEGMMVAARESEDGGITGKSGDQTGHEIERQEVYDFPWNYILRYVGE